MSRLPKTAFHSEAQAFDYLEKTLWPDGPVCPHCGTVGNATKLEFKAGTQGKRTARIGVWQCNEKECRKQFTAKVGTVFEHGRIPLHKMLQAVYLLCCSKKGCSSHQLHRILGITYKSAWFLSHRIREAMREGSLAPMGGPGSIVEADETYIGRQQGLGVDKSGYHNKNMVVTLVERGGSARSFHTDGHSAASIYPIVLQNIHRESRLMTDKAPHYRAIGDLFADHGAVAHERDEYVRGDIHTNTVEGFYSIFKRGMKGVYQHCSEKHLHRYLAEFDFRYSRRAWRERRGSRISRHEGHRRQAADLSKSSRHGSRVNASNARQNGALNHSN
jgi:transposase-like protein